MINATKPFIRISLAIVLICLMLWPATLAEHRPTAPPAICEKGKSLNIVAHQDDDLLFLNPDIQRDISAGKCVTTVFVTIGDYGHNQGLRFAENRENGSKAAYAEMAGVADRWVSSNIKVANHRILSFSLSKNPRVKLIFMRLPNTGGKERGWYYYNYQSPQQLYEGKISKIEAADGSASYTRSQLVETLAQIINGSRASIIRTQDFTQGYNRGDHGDHVTVALLVKEANQKVPYNHELISYMQYRISQLPENLDSQERLKKEKAWLTYVPYDPNVCQTLEICNQPKNPYYNYYSWLGREYEAKAIYTKEPSVVKNNYSLNLY